MLDPIRLVITHVIDPQSFKVYWTLSYSAEAKSPRYPVSNGILSNIIYGS